MNIEKTRISGMVETVINSTAHGSDRPRPYCVSLRDVCKSCDINHIKTQEVQEISREILRRNPFARPIRLMHSTCDSLFCSLCFVDCDTYVKAIANALAEIDADDITHDSNGFLMIDNRFCPAL